MPVTPVELPSAPVLREKAEPDAATFDGAMAVVGHTRRSGRWTLPRLFRAVAWMGGVDVELTEAVIPPDGAAMELLAVLGVITVHIPADLSVELVGDAITWSAEAGVTVRDEMLRCRPDAAVRITGRAVFGKIHVRFVRPFMRADG